MKCPSWSVVSSSREIGQGGLNSPMVSPLQEYANDFRKALSIENYNNLAQIISLESEIQSSSSLSTASKLQESKRKQAMTLKMKVISELDRMMVEATNFISENEIWNSLFTAHLKVLKEISNTNESSMARFASAANEQINVLNAFIRIFTEASQLPLLYVIGDDCWNLAVRSGSPEAQEQAARAINRLFIACITERSALSPQSRKWGTYRAGGLLLRVYFHLGQLNLIQNVLKALQACELPQINEFPRAHTVTFNYFLGRYHFNREEFEAAEAAFSFCFDRLNDFNQINPAKGKQNIPKLDFKKHLSSVLHYMIPIKLILHLSRPSEQLVSLFESDNNRAFYSDLINIIGAGDLEAFNELLRLNLRQLLNYGSFGLYEKLTIFVIRRRIQRIHQLADNPTRISLKLLHNVCGGDQFFKLDEISGLVANSIARGLIRGYISEEKQFLVLSAQNPFPDGLKSILCDK